MKRKYFLIGLVVILAGVTGFVILRGDNTLQPDQASTTQTNQSSNDVPSVTPSENSNTSKITLLAVGDLLPHDSININAETPDGYNYLPYFDNIKDELKGDVIFCNQESPSAGLAFGIAGYPSFNAPTQFSKDLNSLGCNAINLANNHVADRGVDGIEATLENWGGLKTTAVTGANQSQAKQDTISYFEIKGIKFAMVAFTDLSNNTAIPSYSVNMFSDALVTNLVGEADKNADVVLVSAHWGVEYSPTVSSGQEYWANLLAQNGADIIIGTGPHVLQTADIITKGDNQTLVFYSLGNLLSTQLELEQLIGGVAKIEIDPNDLSNYELSFTPTYMHYEWTAVQAAAEDLLSRRNLKLYKLSQSAEALTKSLFNSSVADQTKRVTDLLNQNIPITITD